MTDSGLSNRNRAANASVAPGECADVGNSVAESTEAGQKPTHLLGTIGAPGLADIELDCSLPRQVPRVAAFD